MASGGNPWVFLGVYPGQPLIGHIGLQSQGFIPTRQQGGAGTLFVVLMELFSGWLH